MNPEVNDRGVHERQREQLEMQRPSESLAGAGARLERATDLGAKANGLSSSTGDATSATASDATTAGPLISSPRRDADDTAASDASVARPPIPSLRRDASFADLAASPDKASPLLTGPEAPTPAGGGMERVGEIRGRPAVGEQGTAMRAEAGPEQVEREIFALRREAGLERAAPSEDEQRRQQAEGRLSRL
jgi:hypothetical protein